LIGPRERSLCSAFTRAVKDSETVNGLTHEFYRYPARFSPSFARAAIELFSSPGDLVLDPFMGGGTTLVEGAVLGRPVVGIDLNPVAVFVARVKTRCLTHAQRTNISKWSEALLPQLNTNRPPTGVADANAPIANMSGRMTWPTRKLIAVALSSVAGLDSVGEREFARCTILKTAQWALDGREIIPAPSEFRDRLMLNVHSMIDAAKTYAQEVSKVRRQHEGSTPLRAWCVSASAKELPRVKRLQHLPPPRLILTSPPYAGIHVLYHRWQVGGRRETPAPFWIVDSPDGHGGSHYTFADRTNSRLYFEEALASFLAIASVADRNSLMVQLVGFSDVGKQLAEYLKMLRLAGWREVQPVKDYPRRAKRLWRSVPNRKWYADQKGMTAGSREVVLFHQLA
jgi:hypothetical protein